jgi:phosphatidylinositol glycan class A protein
VVTHSYPPSRVGIRWLVPGIKVYYVPLPVLVSQATLPNYLTFLPWIRPILLREHITIIHGHAALSSLAQEAILHSHLFGIRTVFTDHSLFALDDATGILTNKLLAAALNNVDAVICVSHTAYGLHIVGSGVFIDETLIDARIPSSEPT